MQYLRRNIYDLSSALSTFVYVQIERDMADVAEMFRDLNALVQSFIVEMCFMQGYTLRVF